MFLPLEELAEESNKLISANEAPSIEYSTSALAELFPDTDTFLNFFAD